MTKLVRVDGRGVATGWTGVDMSTPLLPETIPEIDADPAIFLGVGVGIGVNQRTRTAAGCKCIFLQCSPIHLLAIHQ